MTGIRPVMVGPIRVDTASLQAPDQLVAAPVGPAVRAGDQRLEIGDELGADSGVSLNLLGVVADHETLGAGALVTVALAAWCDSDVLDAQVSATVR